MYATHLQQDNQHVNKNLPPDMIHHFPHGLPATFLSLLINLEPDSLGHK